MRGARLLLGDTATSKVMQSDSATHSLLQSYSDKDGENPGCYWSSSKEQIELDFGVVGPHWGRKLPSHRVLETASPASTLLHVALETAWKCQALPSISAAALQGLS